MQVRAGVRPRRRARRRCRASRARAPGLAPGFVQLVRPDGATPRPARRRRPRPGRRRPTSSRRRGDDPTAVLSDRTRRRRAPARHDASPLPGDGRGRVRPLAERRRRRARPAALGAASLLCVAGTALAAAAEPRVRPPRHGAGRRPHRGRRAHRGDRRPRPADRGAGRGRARPARAAVQRDARPARRVADALGASLASQRRLVADASHELRTPVTSLRTNAEVLRDAPDLADAERDALLADVVAQAEELGDARRRHHRARPRRRRRRGRSRTCASTGSSREAVDRAHRHAPGVVFETTLAPCVVEGAPDRLGRAVNNLLDNAAKHSPPGGVVEVTRRGAAS